MVPEPGNPQALNRYSYVLNDPLRYNDPSGHRLSECGLEGSECGGGGASSSYSEGELPDSDFASSPAPVDTTPSKHTPTPSAETAEDAEAVDNWLAEAVDNWLGEIEESLSSLQLRPRSIGIGGHVSGGLGVYGDLGVYGFTADTGGDVGFVQLYVGGGGTTGIFGEITPVIFISNAPLEKWPGPSVNVGGSVETGFSFGFDLVLWKDKQGHHYYGVQLTLPVFGAGGSPEFALPVEFHGGLSYTFNALWRRKK